ncbi:MAG: right-handed parallel beta-helix repeat-containing protein, partial [Acaryochloris sp. CRU_2_0]|nr:right-handed parallel beta-helix repeat-containing protein [Acaryochloris sp. CRU_2_0]
MHSPRLLQPPAKWLRLSRGTILAGTSLTTLLLGYSLLSRCQGGCQFMDPAAAAPTAVPTYPLLRVVVNSPVDGDIQADDALTLREAIALTNGTLKQKDLSAAEQAQVSSTQDHSRIEFDLPAQDTTIRLQSVLPTLASPNLVVDGTSQPGYAISKDQQDISVPIVALTPAPKVEVFRGLTIAASGVQVQGLSLYGFTSTSKTIGTTPSADIFIAHPLLPAQRLEQNNPAIHYPNQDPHLPQGVVITANWLGLAPKHSPPPTAMPNTPRSSFGVSIYNAIGTRILNNRIAHHQGSAVITSVRAERTEIAHNLIENNGLAGMADGIHLEGRIEGTRIRANQITNNGGSGIFLFRTAGATRIQDNQITRNGRRLPQAAIYLMGNDHQVLNNTIADQPGPGVVIAAYPTSIRNLIQDNRFANLAGLSIDLVGRHNRFLDRFARLDTNRVDLTAPSQTGVQDYQRGDGPNPQRNSKNRQRDTANRGINTPQFLSSEFFLFDQQVTLDGTADPGVTVMIYKVKEQQQQRGPLSEPLTATVSNQKGQ